jgi:ubiquinone/menaquinone biosynthesis C-methylase UbiE
LETIFFDGAYATESLEHAVEIERAVSEICRVVRSWGRITVIDKKCRALGPIENAAMGTAEAGRLIHRLAGGKVTPRFCPGSANPRETM